MADHGGLSMALEAYNTWRRTNRDVRLPALPFDDMQLFFLGYALPWCARHTDKHSAHQILNDEHAPERSDVKLLSDKNNNFNFRFRVLGPLSNNPEFAAAFSCPIDTPMNPQDKCRIW